MSVPETQRDDRGELSVRVLYFAAARQRAGIERETLEVAPPYRLDTLKTIIYQAHPELSELDPYLRWAVNQSFVEGEVTLCGGDEVALIPPISGG